MPHSALLRLQVSVTLLPVVLRQGSSNHMEHDPFALSGGLQYSIHKNIIPSGKVPSGRGGASAVYADGKIVTFGGHYFEGNDKFKYLDETWLLDVEKLAWFKMKCSGLIPGPRYGHSAHIFGSRMFIFGGKGPDGIAYKDVFFLDLVEWIWVPVTPITAGPSSRFYHASEVVGRKMVVHGGWDGSDVLSDMWIFDTDSFSWMQPKTAGFEPTARYGHSMTLTSDGRLIVFGGCSILNDNGTPSYNNDLRQLDTASMMWVRPRIDGQLPTGRYGHTATLMDDGRILIFGGWGKGGLQTHEAINDKRAHSTHVLDTRAMNWYIPVKASRKEAKHPYNHSAARSTGTSAVFVFGGFDGRQAINDFSVINLQADEANFQ